MARHFLFQLLQALNFLHKKGIAHCDLKPGNLLIANAASAQLRLTDFHLSRSKADPILPGANASPSFAPPEWYLLTSADQAQDTSYEKFDIWAVGIIFYMTLCNVHPLGDPANKTEMKQIMEHLRANGGVIEMPPSLPEDAKVLKSNLNLVE